jgi:hypothetical protein
MPSDIVRLLPGSGGGASGTVAWVPGENDGTPFNSTGAVALTNVDPTFDLACLGTFDSFIASISYDAVTCVGDVVTLVYDAIWLAGPDAAVNDGPDNWTNPNNATGLRDATEASRAGQLLATTDANLRLTYADPSGGIETFTISTVELRYDTRQTGTSLNNGGLTHEYRIGGAGAWTTLETFTADVDNNPKTYDITTVIGGSWTNINDLQVRVRAVLDLATNLVTCFCDSVELRIVATKTVSV